MSIGLLVLIGFGVGAIISSGTNILTQSIDKGWENINWWQVALEGLIGGINGALAMSTLNALALCGIGAGLGFIGGLGGALLNEEKLNSLETWSNILNSTVIGAISGLGAGARNAISLNKAKKTTEFLKAASSYEKVLNKIAAGGYKNLAGAAGARFLTGRALNNAWNKMVLSQISRSLVKSLLKSGAITLSFNLAIVYS